ncbi:PTS sugar transporter subunit IIC [Mycoplasma sp. P36-A1]|uniref:PTS sugar transporter subunit IIC n=1 Tax=Mycoplasma sp. P36-A1 TaxID=3252900 RepID=UPI003C2AD247
MKIIKDNMSKILNGMSIGIIVALMPEAVFGEIIKALHLTSLTPFLSISTAMMGATIGVCIALKYKYDMISASSLIISTFVAAGSMKGINEEGMIMLKGAGDIINCMIGAVIAISLINFFGPKLKAYKLILLPAITIITTSAITSFTAPSVSMISVGIGEMINSFTVMQPLIMSILIAISFAIIIVSPISTVAIALLISLTMNSSAAATMGVACMAMTMGILSYKANGAGTAIAHFMGSPKIQMANCIKNPKIIIPGIISAIICSTLVPIFNIQGTPMSAGFGLAGLIGPLGHLNKVGFSIHNLLITGFVFIVAPVITSLVCSYVFKDKMKIVDDEAFKLDY